MSEARKRARGKGTAEQGPPPAAPPPAETAPESLVFPAEPRAGEPRASGARISLPSSGLAEDILGLAEARAVAPAAPAAPAPAALAPAEASRAHNISFFAAPAREQKKALEATEHLVTFYLAGEEYGVDVRLVQEIIRVTEITQIPRAPEFIKGVINLRGRIIPVVDLKRKLNLGEVEHNRQARIVVVKLRERMMGLLVDGASQVLKIPVSVIEPPPEEVVEIDADYIRGVAKLAARLIILVDLPKILAFDVKEAAVPVSPA